MGNLTLVTGDFGDDWTGYGAFYSPKLPVPALHSTPSTYRLLYPHQYYQYVLQGPFFYQDDRRTYFVMPTPGPIVSIKSNANLARLDPVLLTRAPTTAAPIIGSTLLGTSSATMLAPASNNAAAVAVPLQTQALTMNWATRNAFSRVYWIPPLEWQIVTGRTYNLQFVSHFHPYVCEFIKALNRKGIPGLLTVDTQLNHEQVSNFSLDYKPDRDRVELPYPSEEVDLGPEGKSAYSLYNLWLAHNLCWTQCPPCRRLAAWLRWADAGSRRRS